MIATIGYEKTSQEDFISTLLNEDIEVLVDIRDRAQSRRPGFSKTALAQAVNNAGMEYIHFKALGDPKEGREAARAGLIEKFQEIFASVMAGDPAKEALLEVESIAKSKRICLMCYEKNHDFCHRKIVSEYLEKSLGWKAIHLGEIRNSH